MLQHDKPGDLGNHCSYPCGNLVFDLVRQFRDCCMYMRQMYTRLAAMATLMEDI